MGARKSESRLPSGMSAQDLGDSVVSADGRCALIAHSSAPVVAGRDNDYVLMTTDPGLAATATSFSWTFVENGVTTRTETTGHGYVVYRPVASGLLSVDVRVLDAGGSELGGNTLEQDVTMPSIDVEDLIGAAQERPGPEIGDPEALRELVNQYGGYYSGLSPTVPEAGDAFLQLLFRMALDGVAHQSATTRRTLVEDLAGALERDGQEFAVKAASGVGVCGIRLALLAMVLPNPAAPYLAWTELPEPAQERAVAERALRQSLGALSDDVRCDLLTVARFPKSNIVACARLLEALRNRYYAGVTFADLVAGQAGMRTNVIWRDYREGPLVKA